MHRDSLPESSLVTHLFDQASRPLSSATRARLAQAMLDWFTAGLAAQDMPAAGVIRRVAQECAPGEGVSLMFGGGCANPVAAGFANAAIAHLREIDDAHRAAMLHPGIVVISPVLALAPALELSRAQVARAIVTGYEVALRVGEAQGPGHAAIFHATATAGAIAAAAAVGMAMGLDAGRLHHALGIAATQSAGLWQFVDDKAHESKALHPAFAVRNGMSAAFAARAGLPGARAFVTGRRGLYAALSGDGPIAALDRDFDGPERLHTTTIKAWPSCAMLFTALDAAHELIGTYGIAAADVMAVDVEIFSHALKIAGVHWPSKPAEASFCLRYLLAVLLHRGTLGIADTDAPDIESPELRALAQRITVRPSEAFQQAFPHKRKCCLTITLRDGRCMSSEHELRRGDPELAFDWDGMLARLHSFVPRLDQTHADALDAWCRGFTDPQRDEEGCTPQAGLFVVAPR